MLSRKIFVAIFLILSLQAFAQEETDSKEEKFTEIEVAMNIEKIIKLDFVPGYVKAGNEQNVDTKISPQKKEIMIIGLKANSSTTITVRDAAGDIKVRYKVNITSSEQTKVVGQLKDLLKDVEGIEIGIKGEKVYVGGQIAVPSDIGRVNVVLSQFADVLFFVELSPHTQLIIAKKMQEEIQKSNFKDITVRVVNGQFWIEGVVNSQDEADKVKQIVVSYLPDTVVSLAKRTDSVQSIKKNPYEILLTINTKPKPEPIPKLFKITTQFVELTKTYDKVFGFGWTPLLSGGGGSINIGKSVQGGVTTGSNGTLAATISNLIPKLNAAKSAGHARVLQSGVIVVKENIEGQLNKTSTIPYVLGSGDSTKSGTATAGLKVFVTPTMLQEEKINLKISISVSSTVANGSAAPTTLDNSISTQIVVKSQEAAVVGGVVSNKTTNDFDKDSPNANDKIEGGSALFSFVKSKNYSTNRSQFVIFITPEVIESASTGVGEIERKFRKRSR